VAKPLRNSIFIFRIRPQIRVPYVYRWTKPALVLLARVYHWLRLRPVPLASALRLPKKLNATMLTIPVRHQLSDQLIK
jgi:hypothetical protein